LFHGPTALLDAGKFLAGFPHDKSIWDALALAETALPPGGPPQNVQKPTVPIDIRWFSHDSGQQHISVQSDAPLTKADVDFINTHDASIVVVGRLRYYDITGAVYWTDSCYAELQTGDIMICGGTKIY
jgi:hypothetical protein